MSDLTPAWFLMAAGGIVAWVLIRRWRTAPGRRGRPRERVQIEDALKHLQDLEYQGLALTVERLAAAQALPADRAAELLAALEARGLVDPSGDGGWRLTAQGRREALRVVRIHRLWERFLADETGYTERDWHREADRLEHLTSLAEADALEARMGHPQYDPHGDPIPTAGGLLPPRRGRPLTGFRAGDSVVVVHVEDEPEAVYADLVAEDIHPGQPLRLLSSSETGVRIESLGRERVLSPAAAALVLAEPAGLGPGPGWRSLSALAPGESGRIVELAPACRGQERRRLMDLGLVRGTVVRTELESPSGGLTAYRVRGALIALRVGQAEHVRIEPVKEAS